MSITIGISIPNVPQAVPIENERNALKTEYDTVKDLIKKNIERGYKTFNA